MEILNHDISKLKFPAVFRKPIDDEKALFKREYVVEVYGILMDNELEYWGCTILFIKVFNYFNGVCHSNSIIEMVTLDYFNKNFNDYILKEV